MNWRLESLACSDEAAALIGKISQFTGPLWLRVRRYYQITSDEAHELCERHGFCPNTGRPIRKRESCV